jgi:hypothetical protein
MHGFSAEVPTCAAELPPALSIMTEFHTFTLASHPGGPFPSRVQTKFLYAFLMSPTCFASCVNFTPLHLFTPTLFGAQCQVLWRIDSLLSGDCK